MEEEMGYFRQRAREALARAQRASTQSEKLGWLNMADRYRSLAELDEQPPLSEAARALTLGAYPKK
jgi:hypothetical protein